MPNHNDRYSKYDRHRYNQHYYQTHREELNRKRNKRRRLRKVVLDTRTVILATHIPCEVLEHLSLWLCDDTDGVITITSSLNKNHIRRAISSNAGRIRFCNTVALENLAQNSPKQSGG